jgi:hypothetical protein
MKKITLLFCLLIASLFTPSAFAQSCGRTLLTDDFSNAANWQSQGAGNVSVTGGQCTFNAAANGNYDRIYRDLGDTLSDTYWKAELSLSYTPNSSGNGVGAVVIALTAGTLDFMSYDASQSYQETNQDGIGVLLHSTLPTDNNPNNWYLIPEGKKDDVRSFNASNVIHLDDAILEYYIRLERTAKDSTRLSVFTDSAFTTHMPNSPVVFAIDSTITDLHVLHHGTITPGTSSRVFTGAIDNDVICDDVIIIGMNEVTHPEAANVVAYPNPTHGTLHIRKGEKDLINAHAPCRIYNVVGMEVATLTMGTQGALDVSSLPVGAYWIEVVDRKEIHRVKFLKQ